MQNKKGFTLVELLGVIVILAIVVSISTTSIFGLIKRSKDDIASDMRNSLKEAGLSYIMGNKNIYLEKCPINVEIDDDNKIMPDYQKCFKEIKVEELKSSGEFEDKKGYCDNASVIVYRFTDGVISEYKSYVKEDYCQD